MAEETAQLLDRNTWQKNAASEVEFWDNWLATKGHQWPKDFAFRTDPEAPLSPLAEDLIGRLALPYGPPVRILDIGSGPLSAVGYRSARHRIDLTLVDPLADEYNRLLDSAGVKNVPRPRVGFFETALADLGEARFDLVWCFNSLDHAIDPVIGLYNILQLCRIGGGVIFSFHPNEAEKGGYAGLHQWNLDVIGTDSDLVLTRHGKNVSLQGLIAQQTVLRRQEAEGVGRNRVIYHLKKTAECNLSQALLA